MTYPKLTAQQTWYTRGGTDVDISTITKIEIKDSYASDGTEDKSWDASLRNAGTITVYRYGTELIIAGNGSGKISTSTNMSNMFNGMTSLTSIEGIELLDTSNTTNMSYVFYNCKSLISLNLNGWNTSNVTKMYEMFYNCKLLEFLNIETWDVSKVIQMSSMFYGCSNLQFLNLNDWNTESLVYMTQMFRYCNKLTTLEISNWDVSNVTSMYWVFASAGFDSIDLSNWNTINVTNMAVMFGFNSKLKNITFGSNWNTSNVIDISGMFHDCKSLVSLDVSNWDISSVEDTSSMFNDCTSLINLDGISNWDTSNVKNMEAMFQYASKLSSVIKRVDLGNGIKSWNTHNVTNMGFMFYNCNKLKLDVSDWDVSKVTTFDHMFRGTGLTIDISNWDVSSAENIYCMLHNTNGPNDIIDVSKWDVSNVKYFGYLFKGTRAKEIKGLENWNTSNGREFDQMFINANRIKYLNLSNFDTTNARTNKNEQASANNASPLKNTANMFDGMTSLESIVLGPKFNFNGNGTNTTVANIAVLPTPSSGYWYTENGKKITSKNIPYSADKVVTYYANPLNLKLSINYNTVETIANNIRSKINSTDLIQIDDFNEKIDEVFLAGKENGFNECENADYDTGYNRGLEDGKLNYLKILQDNGNRSSYAYFYYNNHPDSFDPIYDIEPNGSMASMFQFFNQNNKYGEFDLVEKLKANGTTRKNDIKFSTSKSAVLDYIFYYSGISRIPEISFLSEKNLMQNFMHSTVKKIDKIILTDDGSLTFNQPFNNCTKLEELIVEGVIGQEGFNISDSTLLNKTSIISIINALSSTTTNLTVILSKVAVNNAFETSEGLADGTSSPEWNELTDSKSNWIIKLV